MKRDVSCHLELSADGPAELVFSVAVARGVPVVSLTDSAFSPLAECSRIWFELAEADHAGFRSLSASMALAMALTVGVAEVRRHPKG